MPRLARLFLLSIGLLFIAGLLGAGVLGLAFWHYSRDLPNYQQLADYEPPVMTRVHAGDGSLIAEFAHERRLFVPIDAMPKLVTEAFIAAEDQHFYTHPGVDAFGLLRAVFVNLSNIGQSRRPVGASTITQQVAKNFLLTNELSYQRKIKEAILAFRIERAFNKKRILELYLNEIYLGIGSYGVAAAALNYFGKSLDELSIEEAAFLAALPKAPNNYHPQRFPQAAKARRDYVLDRMSEDNVVTREQAEQAKARPLITRERREVPIAKADWYAEEVRRDLLAKIGDRQLYEGGLSVRTSMSPQLQKVAERVLRKGLVAYDRRHGWRKPIAHVELTADWMKQLATAPVPQGIEPWRAAIVLSANDAEAEIGFADGTRGRILLGDMSWARAWKKDQQLGPPLRSVADVLRPGDIVPVEATVENSKFALRQIPDVGGALIAMDPHTGRVLALVGGFDFQISQFNRATQAMRQPGSSFKPFVYTAALEHGFTPSSLVLDAPFVLDLGPGQPKWKPGNYTGEFFGPSTLRLGIEKSRNLMTVRLAQSIGMDVVSDYARRFGIYDKLPQQLSMSLGAGETTLLKLATAYAELVNGGLRVSPSLIDRIQDRNGKTIFKHDKRTCPDCLASENATSGTEPKVADTREAVVESASAYQMVSMLQGVVERGTGIRIRELGRPLAGKTGTSNDYFDTWFIGFSPDLVAGVFVGFDTPRTLGAKETGSAVAVPIFRDFMAEALAGQPAIPFRVPPGIRLVKVDPASGLPAAPGQRSAILEAFRPGSEPTGERTVLDGSEETSEGLRVLGISTPSQAAPTSGTGGLY